MSENNSSIYEIAQLMRNPESLNQDFATAMSLVSHHFHGKYIKPLMAAIEGHSKVCSHNPSKEMIFLQSCKPFISTGASDTFENIINMFNTIDIIKSITREYNANVVTTASVEDPAIHPDGVYEVDKSCIQNCSQNIGPESSDFIIIFLALAFLLSAKR